MSRLDSFARAQPLRAHRGVAHGCAIGASGGVEVLAHSPCFKQTLYQAKLDKQSETQETFCTLNTHGIDDYTRHVPLAIAYGLIATDHHGARPAVSVAEVHQLVRSTVKLARSSMIILPRKVLEMEAGRSETMARGPH